MTIKKINQNNTSPNSYPIYRPENIKLFEAIYGRYLISLGGFTAVDNLFSGLDVKGLTALDLGFGLGGVAFYLAQNYQMNITGIEMHPWMVKYANDHAPQNIAHLLKFCIYNDRGEIPVDRQSFDLVYSKGVLNHVHDKVRLFQQVYEILKPRGLFVIADWIYPKIPAKKEGPLAYETEPSYQNKLVKAGFSEIHVRDDSRDFMIYVEALIQNLIIHQDFITHEYGKDIYSIVWNEHQQRLNELQNKKKFAVRIIAKKKYK